MVLLRRALGDTLRGERLSQHRTLREVSSAARVSLGYLSEIERGQKEASSELLSAICDALEVGVSEVLRGASDNLHQSEVAEQVAAERVVLPVRTGLARKVVIPPPAEDRHRVPATV
ncbi:MAG: helix-turn-helix domain-containing protein [Mycobacteriales bacterium]